MTTTRVHFTDGSYYDTDVPSEISWFVNARVFLWDCADEGEEPIYVIKTEKLPA